MNVGGECVTGINRTVTRDYFVTNLSFLLDALINPFTGNSAIGRSGTLKIV